jgi:hypothetical protein
LAFFGLFKKKLPVVTWQNNGALYVRYKTSYGHTFEVAVYPDPKSQATFLVKANGSVIGRFWVEDDGARLGVSDTVAPLKYVD